MKTDAYAAVLEQAKELTSDEQLELATKLIALARGCRKEPKIVDLNKYAGTVKLSEDPLEYQHRVRAEWP